MNFKWSHNIHKDEDYSTKETSEKESQEGSPYFLPNFCKPIGLMIAFLPLVFKIKQLFFASIFHDPFRISDRTLFFTIMGGLLIEALSKPKIDTLHSATSRTVFIIVTGFVFLTFLVPFIAHTISEVWHWLF